MADVSVWYSRGIKLLADKAVALSASDSIRMHLCKKSYTPDAAAHEDVADLTLCDAAGGTAYTSKAMASSNMTVTDSSDGATYWDYTDSIVWSSLGGNTDNSVRYAVVYFNNSSADAGRNLLCCLDFGSGTIASTNGSDLKVTINASGIGKIATS